MHIELKRLHVDYKRVNASREELEFRILEFEDQIKRLTANIELQKVKEIELLEQIKNFQENI